jgi:hypothetical protein
VILGVALTSAGISGTPPSGWTERVDTKGSASNYSVYLMERPQPTAGASPTAVITFSFTSSNVRTFAIAVKASASATPTWVLLHDAPVGVLPTGGATGQVLQKTSGTDYATGWTTPSTDIPVSIVDVKGDLIAATAPDTVARLPAGANGQLLAADNTQATGLRWTAALPGAELAYAEVTTALSVTSTTEATSQLVVGAPATVFDGNPVVVEFYSPIVQPPVVAVGGITLYLSLDAAIIGVLGRIINPVANTAGAPVLLRRRLTPTAATHTFVIGASVSSGTGVVVAGPGGSGQFLPAYIRITRA